MKSKEEVPEAFLFALSSYSENVYLKFHDPYRPVMLNVCDGRPIKSYDKMKEVLGLKYSISEGKLPKKFSSIADLEENAYKQLLKEK